MTPVRVSLNESLPFVDGISADSNSIGGMRALIGRKFGEESVQEYIEKHPELRIEKGEGDRPVITTRTGRILLPE